MTERMMQQQQVFDMTPAEYESPSNLLKFNSKLTQTQLNLNHWTATATPNPDLNNTNIHMENDPIDAFSLFLKTPRSKQSKGLESSQFPCSELKFNVFSLLQQKMNLIALNRESVVDAFVSNSLEILINLC